MKRRDLLRHLRSNDCNFYREGGRHSIWKRNGLELYSQVPRHNEIARGTVRKICRDLQISVPF